jgi:hypothetical protein
VVLGPVHDRRAPTSGHPRLPAARHARTAQRTPEGPGDYREADVLRDEGEAYARKLRAAGVDVTAVRYEGIIHDFVMLNALRGTNAAENAIAQAITYLRQPLS